MRKNNYKLNNLEFLEMSEYSHQELLDMFKRAIEEQAERGIIGPEDAKKYLANIDLWLLELLEN